MKKILFVSSFLDKGGAEKVVSVLSYAFPKEYKMEVLLNAVSDCDFPFNGKIISMQMKHCTSQTLWYQIRAFVKRVYYLRRLRKKNEYEAVISFSDSTNVANILTRMYSGKTILSVHTFLSSWETFNYKYVVGPLVRLFYNKSDKVVTVSKDIERDLVNNYGIDKNKIVTINNGFDINSIGSDDITQYNDNKRFRFITVGALHERKGTWHLIRAFSNVKKQFQGTELIILGEGENKGYLDELIKDYKLEESVLLKGFVQNVRDELIKSDCFVMSSMVEGFPMALCEAISYGLPAVCSDFYSGARDIIAPEYEGETLTDKYILAEYGILAPKCSGIHYKACDPLEIQEIVLSDAMAEMMKNDAVRKKYREISKKSIERFSISECVNQWIRVIQN